MAAVSLAKAIPAVLFSSAVKAAFDGAKMVMLVADSREDRSVGNKLT